MKTSDWINIAICNKKRMMLDPERIYTFKDTCKHDRFLEVWQTTKAALNLAETASAYRNSTSILRFQDS